MEKSLLEEALSKSANYTESTEPGQIFDGKPLIPEINSRARPRHAGVMRRFAQ
jgi:hypothetical protein